MAARRAINIKINGISDPIQNNISYMYSGIQFNSLDNIDMVLVAGAVKSSF